MHLKAKLVTLSACNTGVGPVGEAGVANLVNAFIEAGADSVVSTLWELEDHTTERMMTMFYSQLARHDRKVDALRVAQSDLLNQGLPPYFWSIPPERPRITARHSKRHVRSIALEPLDSAEEPYVQ